MVTAVLGREVPSYILLLNFNPSFAKADWCSIACAHQDERRALGVVERHCLQMAPSLQHDRFGLHLHCLKVCTSPDFKCIKMKGILQNYVLEYLRSSCCSVLLDFHWSSFKNIHTIVFTRPGFDIWILVLPGK